MYIDLDRSVKNDNPKLDGIDLSNPHAPVPIGYPNLYQANYFDGIPQWFKMPENIEMIPSQFQRHGCLGESFCENCNAITTSSCQCMGVCKKCKTSFLERQVKKAAFSNSMPNIPFSDFRFSIGNGCYAYKNGIPTKYYSIT